MQTFPPTWIWRHRKENLKKCSLRGLEGRLDVRFFTYPQEALTIPEDMLLLDLEAPPLTEKDEGRGLVLLDATWRKSLLMRKALEPLRCERRSLPPQLRTAYPRRQDDCSDPQRGLASIEALYVAYAILGRPLEGLLENYYWKEAFLQENRSFFKERETMRHGHSLVLL